LLLRYQVTVSIFSVACMILVLSSFSTKAELDKVAESTSLENMELTSSYSELGAEMFASCCTRSVSNTHHCNSGTQYAFYLFRTDDKGATITESYRIGSGSNISWSECDDGTAHLSATGLVAVGSSETINLNINYSGKQTSGSGKANICDNSVNLGDWSYYANTSGTFTSNHHGTFNIAEKGGDFQTGTKANVTSASGFGGSGWFTASGGDGYWTDGDVNIQLSSLECAPPNPTCSGGDFSWSGMQHLIDGGTTEKCFALSGFQNALEIDITEVITFDCYTGRSSTHLRFVQFTTKILIMEVVAQVVLTL